MNHVIAEFIKRKLSIGKKDVSTQVETRNDPEETEDAGHHNVPHLRHFSADTELNSIQEEASILGPHEQHIMKGRPQIQISPETRERKRPNTFHRLRKRVSSLPDLHVKAFDKVPDSNSLRSGPQQNTSEMSSSSNGSIEINKEHESTTRWLPRNRKEMKLGKHSSASKKDISFIKLKTPPGSSVNSSSRRASRSRSSSRSRSRSTSFRNSYDIFSQNSSGKPKVREQGTNEVSGLSPAIQQENNATSGISDNFSTNSCTEKPLKMDLIHNADENRRRSRTVGASDSRIQEVIPGIDFPHLNIGRVRSNSCNSGSFLNGPSTPKTFPFSQSRRRNSFVTTLTNFVSLKSMTAFSIARPSIPAQLPFEDMEKPPKPKNKDDPQSYLDRIVPIYQKYVALVLCSHSDKLLASCMHRFLDTEFSFSGEPLDISLRKLLLFIELPKESQQIDRLLKAFSNIYFSQNMKTNTDVTVKFWIDSEHVFFMVYSLLVLHTDNFNPNNKEKLKKEEFLKLVHTDSESLAKHIPREYVEYLFDNITSKEFPQVVLPPYYVIENGTSELDSEEYWHIEGYSPKALIDSHWLANRAKLILTEKQTTSGSQYLHPPHQLTMGSLSSTPSVASLSLNDEIDPYVHIINDTLEVVQLGTTEDIGKQKSYLMDHLFERASLRRIISILTDIKGGYLKFRKSQMWKMIEKNDYEVLLPDDSSEFAYLKIMQMDQIEVKVSTRKFSIVGNSLKSHWKTKFVILTTSYLIFFDDMMWMDPISEFDERGGVTNYIIDLSGAHELRFEIDRCSDLFIVDTDSERSLTLLNQNTKLEVLLASKSDAISWKRMIYFVGSLQGCFLDINAISNTFISERKISIEDKISKLRNNLDSSIAKVKSLRILLKLYLQTSPINGETRFLMNKQVDSTWKRIDMLQYHTERINAYMNVLKQVSEIEPGVHVVHVSDTDSIDQSFLFSRDSRESYGS